MGGLNGSLPHYLIVQNTQSIQNNVFARPSSTEVIQKLYNTSEHLNTFSGLFTFNEPVYMYCLTPQCLLRIHCTQFAPTDRHENLPTMSTYYKFNFALITVGHSTCYQYVMHTSTQCINGNSIDYKLVKNPPSF